MTTTEMVATLTNEFMTLPSSKELGPGAAGAFADYIGNLIELGHRHAQQGKSEPPATFKAHIDEIFTPGSIDDQQRHRLAGTLNRFYLLGRSADSACNTREVTI